METDRPIVRKGPRALFPVITAAVDALSLSASCLLAYWARFHSGWFPTPLGVPPLGPYLVAGALVLAVWLLLFRARGLFDHLRFGSLSEELWQVSKGVTAASVLLLAALFFYRDASLSRTFFVGFWALCVVFTALGRVAGRSLQRKLARRGVSARRVLIVGTGRMARAVLRRIDARPGLGYRVVGVLSEDSTRPPVFGWVTENGLRRSAPSLGFLDDLVSVVETQAIDTVIVTLPLASHHLVLDMLAQCEGRSVEIQLVPDLFEMMVSRLKVREIDGIPLLGMKELPLSGLNGAVKRAMDLVLAAGGLVALSPVFAGIAALVKAGSRGPAFYRQRRIGLDGREFDIVKFRSMREDAEKSGPVWGTTDDPRATRIGRFLRRTSLDELPQLWNVVKGEMSLVGPRPERPVYSERFQGEIPRYLERHRVRSGMTGWAQVNGYRGNTSVEERTRHDVYYVENWSLVFDLRILFLTVRHVLAEALGRGARPEAPPAWDEPDGDRAVADEIAREVAPLASSRRRSEPAGRS